MKKKKYQLPSHKPKTLGTSSYIWDAYEISHTIVRAAEYFISTDLHSECTQHEHRPRESTRISY